MALAQHQGLGDEMRGKREERGEGRGQREDREKANLFPSFPFQPPIPPLLDNAQADQHRVDKLSEILVIIQVMLERLELLRYRQGSIPSSSPIRGSLRLSSWHVCVVSRGLGSVYIEGRRSRQGSRSSLHTSSHQ